MNNKYYQALQAIKTCIENIDNFIGTPKVFEQYESNALLQAAVERNLEIIGEATKRLLIIDPTIAISNTRSIINTRNKISHGYDEIENPQIWGIIINHLPILKIEVENLLNAGI
ncbi:HepT-like ribonuclease domain-containing protein [Flavobacterium eburneipallidum]|uniref:HepT-like ribonuclease domain-containing protein n=1 Tax=Flavobacterium eburneipallidum TaxID=3003263 RepID=UPI0022AC4952|nr:HepT-like ribonuclease domain-containing protein [Flavobacterium eburneipallidum]